MVGVAAGGATAAGVFAVEASCLAISEIVYSTTGAAAHEASANPSPSPSNGRIQLAHAAQVSRRSWRPACQRYRMFEVVGISRLLVKVTTRWRRRTGCRPPCIQSLTRGAVERQWHFTISEPG